MQISVLLIVLKTLSTEEVLEDSMMSQVFASLSSFSWSPKWKHKSLVRTPSVQRTSLCLVSSPCYHAPNFRKVLFKVPPPLCQWRNNVVSLMASMNTQGDSSSKEFQWKYDVFLSFRGEDTRKNFTDHLYVALNQKGIVTYRDDPSLAKGEYISNEVLKAIENSKYLVVIMSRNYASSTWCLDELAKIVECMKGGEQMAIPIFYKVDPSDVRKQGGSFRSDFAKHEANFADDMDKVQRWKNAMKEIASLAGWDILDRHESQFIWDIVEDLQNKLGRKLSYAAKNLVGIESRVEDMFLHLSLGSNDVRFIGISGMGGIGKSTLARAVFDEISGQFEGCSFLANIREVSDTLGLVHLQNKLLFDILREKDLIGDAIVGAGVIERRLKHKRVVVVLDDVDRIDQLESLAGKFWFGTGSRIIVTTRDEHLLLKHCVDAIYKAKELSNDEALELFCSRAFGESNPTEEFTNFPRQVIEYAKGLPLALTVLGSFLFGRSMTEWHSALDRLQESPNKQIFETLKLSFDKLEEKEKAIFLDIACFFNGIDKDYVMEILDCCGFYPEIGVKVLIERSLLTLTDNKFMVHDLLREMAWEVVRQKSPEEPGKRSRLFLSNDLNHIMANNTGTERIEGIVLYLDDQTMVDLNAICSNKMTNLRLLVVRDPLLFSGINYLSNEWRYLSDKLRYLSNELRFLSNKLRLLTLDRLPSSYLPAKFQPESLYELNLRHSHLRQLWRGQEIFAKLKRVDLSNSKSLKETPDFKIMPNLEKLILCGCEKLSQIHPSIGVLHNLKFLHLGGCETLTNLPPNIGSLKSLEVLCLKGCSNLEELPDSICGLEHLEELDISFTAITYLPLNLRNLNNLKRLYCRGCKGLWLDLNARGMLLPSLSGFSSLEDLDFGFCHLQGGGMPNDLDCLSSLRNLNLFFNHFSTIPESINRIPRLETLDLGHCENLQALPRLPESILFVQVQQCMKLHSISNLFMICSDDKSNICLFNCLKFLPKDLDIPLAQKYSLALLYYIIGCSVFHDPIGKTYVVAPNCDIPKWFTYQRDGSLLSFGIRDPWFKDEVSGFIVCASFLRQEQDHRGSRHLKCSCDLICEFNVGGNQLGPSFHFPIRFISSNSLWMGFVPLEFFPDDTKWEEIIDERIDVSMRTLDDQLKLIRCGILPVQQQRPHTFRKFIQSGSSLAPLVLSGIFHELAYQKVDYHFPSNSDKKEREDYYELPEDARTCGVMFDTAPENANSIISFLKYHSRPFEKASDIYRLWCNEFKQGVEPYYMADLVMKSADCWETAI